MGYRIHVITDHQALEFFKTQTHLTGRQMRWMDYLSRFNFNITYIKGENNKVADCLSRYYENDTWDDTHGLDEYVQADARIDPNGDDLPPDQLQEVRDKVIKIHAMQDNTRRRSRRLQEKKELRDIEASEMAEASKCAMNPSVRNDHSNEAVTLDPMLADALQSGPDLTQTHNNDDAFAQAVRESYSDDSFFKVILADPEANRTFTVRNDMIWMKNGNGEEVLCIPKGTYKDHSLQEIVLDQGHKVLGHYGYQRTSEYIRRWYWWPWIVTDTREFCRSCSACQQAKGDNKSPTGKLHTLPISSKPWDSIGMDFVGPFPEIEVEH